MFCHGAVKVAVLEPGVGVPTQFWFCSCSGFVCAVPFGGSGREFPPDPPAVHLPGSDPVYRMVV